MGKVELKSNLHRILDQIENEQLLQTIYDFLKANAKSTDAQIWNALTEHQKNEVYASYEESENIEHLISWEAVKKKY